MTSPLKTVKNSKRPRLSLQIQSACNPPSKGLRGQSTDPSDPTTFNTMSNIYVTAIERFSVKPPESISLKTAVEEADSVPNSPPIHVTPRLDTPLTAQPTSVPHGDFVYPSTITATLPLSAGVLDNASKMFTISSADKSSSQTCPSIRPPVDDGTPFRRRGSFPLSEMCPSRMPYIHPRSLHSILRNSPLPSKSAIPPLSSSSSPRRQCLRFREKAAKKVEYNSPLEEEITTFKYTKSHSDLLAEDGSPLSPSDCAPLSAVAEPQIILDTVLSFTGNEFQDGGRTPGPYEDMRRKMAGLGPASPMPPDHENNSDNKSSPRGDRKRKRLEKKRQWVWTIGQDEDDEDVGRAIATFRAQAAAQTAANETMHRVDLVATPSIGSPSSLTDGTEVDMSDSCSNVSSEEHQRRYHSVLSDGNGHGDAKTCAASEGDWRRGDMPTLRIAETSNDGEAL
ncbi:hypothetical protein E4U43_003612 [Claviceps pusilla]|uniref:Uncharacterized protein n=1 Tax=Claviceps pusilla TaxID=123648 RepID=A0A9P7N559_9HYPO|nr:hypothetical protein E4U43_003612 [Claviceps pusilla]